MDLQRRRREAVMSQLNAPRTSNFNWKKPKKILAVDDEQSIRFLVQMSLQSEGYEVITAANGLEALDKVRDEKPDLVVMDVLMPELDGFATLRRLKEDPASDNIPVIMLTAKDSEADILAGWLRGADIYMTKPFDPWQLIANVNNIFFDDLDIDLKTDPEYVGPVQ